MASPPTQTIYCFTPLRCHCYIPLLFVSILPFWLQETLCKLVRSLFVWPWVLLLGTNTINFLLLLNKLCGA
ncbi:hypothetical protein NC652_030899 [Populus alba x Populus x berolinensis]|uniref:Uncharacterized protein n=1 Tax=Populus alba x Populus x berolinensis TaxID=444605 RepID=A0AAD6LWP0_9ROSI|nr:hypothetical protein NC652_030899 [Populus alba x Populus x berolinensis]KAJ6974698.1 hypothetical protein NC653_030733 [Populus alba x Populus x berolinensis]